MRDIIDYDDRRQHCYDGKDDLPVQEAGATTNQRVIRKGVERMQKTAPAGADVGSWQYWTSKIPSSPLTSWGLSPPSKGCLDLLQSPANRWFAAASTVADE